MTVIDPGPNHQNNQGAMAYDLEAEKKMRSEALESIKAELKERWQKRYRSTQIFPAGLAAVHPEVVNFLLSFQLVSFYDSIRNNFNLDQEQRDLLPQVVWQLAAKGDFSRLEERLSQVLKIEIPAARSIAKVISENIEVKISELRKRPAPKRAKPAEERQIKESLPLAEGLKKYDKLGEQLITGSSILLKIFPSPVRPSIKNWISDYHEKAEAKRHDSIERGNYLFHTENAKKLTSGERQRLGAVLRSLDEGTALPIDPGKQQVIFELIREDARRNESSVNPSEGSASGPRMDFGQPGRPENKGMTFSSPQKFTSEGMRRTGAFPARPSEDRRTSSPSPSGPVQPKISGNVVDLRG